MKGFCLSMLCAARVLFISILCETGGEVRFSKQSGLAASVRLTVTFLSVGLPRSLTNEAFWKSMLISSAANFRLLKVSSIFLVIKQREQPVCLGYLV